MQTMTRTALAARLATATLGFVVLHETGTGPLVTRSGVLIIAVLAGIDLVLTLLDRDEALKLWPIRWSAFAATCGTIAYAFDVLLHKPGAIAKLSASLGAAIVICTIAMRFTSNWRSAIFETTLRPAAVFLLVLAYTTLSSSMTALSRLEDAIIPLALAGDALLRFAFRESRAQEPTASL